MLDEQAALKGIQNEPSFHFRYSSAGCQLRERPEIVSAQLELLTQICQIQQVRDLYNYLAAFSTAHIQDLGLKKAIQNYLDEIRANYLAHLDKEIVEGNVFQLDLESLLPYQQ